MGWLALEGQDRPDRAVGLFGGPGGEPLIEIGREVLINVLEARHVTVTEEVREHITGCADVHQLLIWVNRAREALGLEEVFAESPEEAARGQSFSSGA
jgi:hypothetical protein